MFITQTKVPIENLCERLHCSKPFVYRLVDAGIITPFYFDGNFTKPFFDIPQVEQALRPQPDGRTKRKSYNKHTHEPFSAVPARIKQ